MTQTLTDRIFQARFGNKLNEREELVLWILSDSGEGHFGRANAISGEDIRSQAERRGFRMNRRSLSEVVASLVDVHRIPIGTSKAPPAGYFLTVSDEDQEQAAGELVSQAKAMLHRASILSPKSMHGRELLGQLQAQYEGGVQ